MGTKLKIDLFLLAPVIILILIGLTTLASINISYLKTQILSLSFALIIFFLITQIDIHMLIKLKKPIYFISIILLLISLGLGIESRGAVRWIEVFGIRLQLSEIFKPLLSLSFAAHIAYYEHPTLKSFFYSVLFLIPIVLLIYLQPDLGNTLIYIGVFLLTLIIIGFPLRWFTFLLLPFLLTLPLLWTILHEYQKQRILTFLHPHQDPLGTSYNSIQALIAVGSGMFLGKGLGESTQSGLQFLPERHTDFIFATLSEGMGFLGALIVICTFMILLLRIYNLFNKSDNLFEKSFLTCSFFFFLGQIVLNIGMNIGLLPIVGVTLPFLSYGGSSLVANFIFLGIISSISISLKKRTVLEI
jgi:rod shape determining protein RodA